MDDEILLQGYLDIFQPELTLEQLNEWDEMLNMLGLIESYYDNISWFPPDPTANGQASDANGQVTQTIVPDVNVNAAFYSGNNLQICPVPKIKGLYYPTQEQLFKQFTNENCNIQKKLPGTLGGAQTGALSNAQRRGQWLSLRASSRGQTRFVVNGNALGMRAGQPGGMLPPARNRF